MIYFLNGKFVASEKAMISVQDHGFLYGDGVYETLRTYNGRVWQIRVHVNRLWKSARLLGLKLPWKKEEVIEWVEEVVKRNGDSRSDFCSAHAVGNDKRGCLFDIQDFRIRITVTRGRNDFDFMTTKAPSILISIQKLTKEPAEIYTKGVRVITVKGERILPEAKTINLISGILARQEMARRKAYEAFFVNHKGYVTEGAVTNFYIVKNGKLITPSKNILEGTTRGVVLKIARKMMPVVLKNVTVHDLYAADECFCSNAPRGIFPVREIDGHSISACGEWTKKIMKAFESMTQKIS